MKAARGHDDLAEPVLNTRVLQEPVRTLHETSTQSVTVQVSDG